MTGLLKSFFGLSSAILTLVYYAFFSQLGERARRGRARSPVARGGAGRGDSPAAARP